MIGWTFLGLLIIGLILLTPVIPELWNMLRGVLRDLGDWFYKRGPKRTFEELYQETMAVPAEPPPDHQIVLWTSEERANLGQADLLKWMHETDQVLEGLGTDRALRRCQMAPVPEYDDLDVHVWGLPEILRSQDLLNANEIRILSRRGIIR